MKSFATSTKRFNYYDADIGGKGFGSIPLRWSQPPMGLPSFTCAVNEAK